MNNPKADAALNLSLSLPESLHEKSTSLSAVLTGSVWEILVLASQDLSFLAKLYPQIAHRPAGPVLHPAAGRGPLRVPQTPGKRTRRLFGRPFQHLHLRSLWTGDRQAAPRGRWPCGGGDRRRRLYQRIGL